MKPKIVRPHPNMLIELFIQETGRIMREWMTTGIIKGQDKQPLTSPEIDAHLKDWDKNVRRQIAPPEQQQGVIDLLNKHKGDIGYTAREYMNDFLKVLLKKD